MAELSASHSSWYELSKEVVSQRCLSLTPVLLYWIEKQSSHRCILENLESSGANIMMRVNYCECYLREVTSKQTTLVDEFIGEVFRLQRFFCTASCYL